MINRGEFLLTTGGLGLTAVSKGQPQSVETVPDYRPFEWKQSGLSISFDFIDTRIRQRCFLPEGVSVPSGIPDCAGNSGLDVAIHCTGEDWNDHHATKVTGCAPGGRLVYSGTKSEETPRGVRRVLVHRDPGLNLRVESVYEFFDAIPVTRRWSKVVNEGDKDVGIELLSSAMLHNFGSADPAQMENGLRIHFAYNSWKSEGQWRSGPPSTLGFLIMAPSLSPESSSVTLAVGPLCDTCQWA